MHAVRSTYVLARERIAWRHPEWWSLSASVGAWLVILAPEVRSIWETTSAHHQYAAVSLSPWGGAAMADHIRHWLLMVVAMMVPLASQSVRTTAARSLWSRRHRAIAGFLAGYSFPWLLLGILVAVLTEGLANVGGRFVPLGASVAFLIAAAWQLTTIKRVALTSCHQTRPLAPSGRKADRDCLRYGLRIGRHCMVSCGPMMLACALTGHSVLAMVYTSVLSAAERYGWRADEGRTCAALVALAIAYAIAAIV